MRHELVLTPDTIAAGIDQYVGRCLTDCQDEEKGIGLDYSLLLSMCSPRFDWGNHHPSEDDIGFSTLKGLFENPKHNFYRTNPAVHEYHNPELQYVLRCILLRRLLRNKLDEKEKLPSSERESFVAFPAEENAKIRALLVTLNREQQGLAKEKKLYIKTNGLSLMISILLFLTTLSYAVSQLRNLYMRSAEFSWPVIGGLFMVIVLTFTRHFANDIRLVRESLPREICVQIGQSVGPFATYQQTIEGLMQKLGIPLQENAEQNNLRLRVGLAST